MSALRYRVAALVAILSSPAIAANADLKNELARKMEAVDALARQLPEAAGPEFAVTTDLQFRLRTSVIQHWLTRMGTPSFTIAATGTAISDDLFQRPGVRVWIDNPADTKASAGFSSLTLISEPAQLNLSADLTAHAESRVFASIFGVRTNILCGTMPDPSIKALAQFRVLSIPEGASGFAAGLPYVIELVEPAKLTARAVCGLGPVGEIAVEFPIDDIAKTLGEGRIGLGFVEAFVIHLPLDPPVEMPLRITTKNEAATIDGGGITLSADIDLLTGLDNKP